MTTQILRLLCPLSILVGGLCAGNIVSAQETSNGSASSGASSLTARKTGKGTAAKDVLDNPRLLFRVSIERKATTVEQALAKLSEYTPLHLTVQGAEVRSTPLFFHYVNTPLRDILAGIAETGYWEWAQKNENTLVLKERYNPHTLALYHPHNEAEKEVHQRGAEFLDQLGKLPPDMQSALSNPTLPPPPVKGLPGVPFDRLPSAMQDNLRAMFAAELKSGEAKGLHSPLTSADLAHSTVSLSTGTPQEGFDSYHITLSADLPGTRVGMGMSFLMFQDPRDNYDIIPLDQVGGVDYHTVEQDALSRQKALANNPHLQDRVSLTMENATLFQALQALSAKTNLAFSAYHFTEKGRSAQRSFSLPAMPLGEMLDRLAALYGGRDAGGGRYRYTWGQQANPMSQVFVFHLSPEATPPAE